MTTRLVLNWQGITAELRDLHTGMVASLNKGKCNCDLFGLRLSWERNGPFPIIFMSRSICRRHIKTPPVEKDGVTDQVGGVGVQRCRQFSKPQWQSTFVPAIQHRGREKSIPQLSESGSDGAVGFLLRNLDAKRSVSFLIGFTKTLLLSKDRIQDGPRTRFVHICAP